MTVSPFKGFEGKLRLGDDLVGRVSNFSVKVDGGVAPYYGIGNRDPTDIKEGNRAVTGTLNRAVINGALLAAAMGTGTGTTPAVITATALGSYKMKIMVKTSSTQYVYIILTGVKFGSWGINIANTGETVIENLEFIGIFSSAKSYGTPAAGV